jgi:nitroimidazol reductase NimA-like FMN-containing flavoprotein (pyridoxamine 5'-phosphate oxidase superfamily)
MFISELSGDECIDLLIRANFGRMACAKADQPYITPISFAYKNRKVHCASTVGQRIEWMRTNPLVCLQVDEVICDLTLGQRCNAGRSGGSPPM